MRAMAYCFVAVMHIRGAEAEEVANQVVPSAVRGVLSTFEQALSSREASSIQLPSLSRQIDGASVSKSGKGEGRRLASMRVTSTATSARLQTA